MPRLTCGICLERVGRKSFNRWLRWSTCCPGEDGFHGFHAGCVKTWFATQAARAECPTCQLVLSGPGKLVYEAERKHMATTSHRRPNPHFIQDGWMNRPITNDESTIVPFITQPVETKTPVCKLSGYLRFNTNGETVEPNLVLLEYFAACVCYGYVTLVNGRSSSTTGNVIQTWCRIDRNIITFWERLLNLQTGTETVQELRVNDMSTSTTGHAVTIAMEIVYPLDVMPTHHE